MSGGAWEYCGNEISSKLQNVATDERVKERWPRTAAAMSKLGVALQHIEHEMDWCVCCDTTIKNNAAFDDECIARLRVALRPGANFCDELEAIRLGENMQTNDVYHYEHAEKRELGRGGDVTLGGPPGNPVRAGLGSSPELSGDLIFQLPDGTEWLRIRPDGTAWHQQGTGGVAFDDMGAIRELLLRWATKYEDDACEQLREELDEAEDAAGCHEVATKAIALLELARQVLALLRAEHEREKSNYQIY